MTGYTHLATPAALIDFTGDDGLPVRRRFTNPVDIIVATSIEEVRPALRAVERAAHEGYYVVGYVGYEAAPAFDPTHTVRSGTRMPLLWFGVFQGGEVVDPMPDVEARGAGLGPWAPSTSRADYDAAIAAIREAIERGDTGQVNHTIRLHAPFVDAGPAFYRRMLAAQGMAYGAYLELGRFRVLSASPELFFRRADARITVRPMKGTARRGRWVEEDEAAAARLAASQKDRTENRMVADLMRDELGHIAHESTVHVSRFGEIERYRTVHQMTSTLTAELRPETTLEEIFGALFPCASVTGTPKSTAMRMIAELEEDPREVYCGAVGIVEPGGDCTFNVAIRTLWLDKTCGTTEYSVGGAITRDSTAADEYDEALAKAALLDREWPEFELIETLRLERGAFARLERHLERVRESAEYFGFGDPSPAARTALEAHAAAYPGQTRRVRVLADSEGRVRLESVPVLAPTHSPPHGPGINSGEPEVKDHGSQSAGQSVGRLQNTMLAHEPVDRYDPFLCHKTTHREAYTRRFEAAQCAWSSAVTGAGTGEGAELFDVLLWNREGELTEFTRGNLVLELEGRRWTPPRTCGLLAGCFRAELIERGEVEERVLRLEDLERASGAWLINSVREWVPVCIDRVRHSSTTCP